jgi:hypothetical protein
LSGIKEPLDKHPWLEIKFIYQAGSTLKPEVGNWEPTPAGVGCKKPHLKPPLTSPGFPPQMGLFALKPLSFPPPFLWRKEKFRPFRISKR